MYRSDSILEKSIQSFLNSLVRDYANDSRISINSENLIIKFTNEDELHITLSFLSATGNHQYKNNFIYIKKGISKVIPASLLKETIIKSLFKNVKTDAILRNIKESDKELDRIFAAREIGTSKNISYTTSEQNLLLGHPCHPFPKLKKGMTPKESQKYSPEYQSKFKLDWAILENSLLTKTFATTHQNALKELAKFDGVRNIPAGHTPFPLHPWQKHKLENLLNLESTTAGINYWYPTSSMRSLFCANAPYTIKFSLSVQLTNSVRVLTENECMRGLQVTQLKETESVRSHFNKYENFTILGEPYYGSLKGISESSFVLRENFNTQEQECHLLATFLEKNIETNKSLLNDLSSLYGDNKIYAAKIISNSFFSNIIEPILTLATDHGVLLGAHLQNIIITIENNLFKKVIFKDCQGTGFSKLGANKFKSQLKDYQEDNGNILDSDNVNKIFCYYLIVNTAFSFITELANGSSYIEELVINEFKNFLYKTLKRNETADTSILEYLLYSPEIYQKGNFRCSIEKHNENTMSDPTQIYSKISNPISSNARIIVENNPDEILYSKEISRLSRPISFKVMNLGTDIDLFHKWQHLGYVKDFWEMNLPKEELQKYIKGLIDSPYQIPLLCFAGEEVIGYFEVYNAYSDRIAPYCTPEIDDMGFHFLIGNQKFLGTRYVIESINSICDFLFQKNLNTKRIWGEPRADNKKVIKFGTSLPGWSLVKEFNFPHKRAALLKCDRSIFFKEYLSGK